MPRKSATSRTNSPRSAGITASSTTTTIQTLQMRRRARHLMATYGMTIETYERLLRFQGGLCAICRRPPKRRRLAVDHNHKTGAIRGLLCFACNHRVLGRGLETPEI